MFKNFFIGLALLIGLTLGNAVLASAPVISNLNAPDNGLRPTTALITWTTDVPTDSIVMFGELGSSFTWKGVDTASTSHSVQLEALKPFTTYQYYINAKDSSGNITKSETKEFTTTVSTNYIVGLDAPTSTIKFDNVTITWGTTNNSDSFVFYLEKGLTSWSWQGDDKLTSAHSVILPNLKPATTYQYYVNAKDFNGNITKSETKEFTTITATVVNCVDPDGNDMYGGKDAFARNTISGKDQLGNTFSYTDECNNSGTQVKEWYCAGGNDGVQKPYSVYYNCANGCLNGACKQQNTTNTTTCIDSDGGLNYYVKGWVDLENSGKIGDQCAKDEVGFTQTVTNINNLTEMSCDPHTDNGVTWNFKYNTYTCPNGCADGVCLQLETNGEQNNTGEDALTPAKVTKTEDNKLTLQLNRLISALEQKVMDLETRLTAVINKILTNRLKGQILIQPEANGEVWYTSPDTGERFYVANGQAAYGILSGMGKGITNKDLQKVAIGYDPNLYGGLLDTDQDGLPDVLEQAIGTDPNKADTDGDGHNDLAEAMGGYNPNGPGNMPISLVFAKKLKGIYLDVNNRGAAWYINPKDFKRYYVSPETAYNVMKFLSLGISNSDLRQVPVGQVSQ